MANGAKGTATQPDDETQPQPNASGAGPYAIGAGAVAGVAVAPLLTFCGPMLSGSVRSFSGSDLSALLWYLPVAYLYVALMSIPLAAPLGALGGWLLIIRLRRRPSRTRLVVEAACVGAALCAGPTTLLWLQASPRSSSLVPACAATIGGIAGVAVAAIVARRTG